VRHGRSLGRLWSRWTRDAGLGFSYREPGNDSLRADMAPAVNPETRLTEWRASIWRGTDRAHPVAEDWGHTHWTCAEAVEQQAREIAREAACAA
jgi:hypothetical protein